MSGVFDHLHIKQHTEGSSNELSFDVLDAARGDLDSKKKRRRFLGRRGGDIGSPQVVRPTKPQQPSPSSYNAQGAVSGSPQVVRPVKHKQEEPSSYHSTAGTPTFARHAEVTRRKRQRKKRSIRLWMIAAIVAVAMMGSAAYVGYGQYQRMQEFQGLFNGIVQGFVAADEDTRLVDEFMTDPFGSSRDERRIMKEAIGRESLRLQQIEDEGRRIIELAVTERDKMALAQVEAATTARFAMLDAAGRALDVAESSASESSEIKSIWKSMLKADQDARAAAETANSASSDEAIKDAREKTLGAKEQMQKSLEKLEAAHLAGSALDLSNHIEYLHVRIGALDHALATADALLDGNRVKAVEENDAYNAADRQAAAIAEDLPLSLSDAVEESFSKKVDECKADYETARNAAIEADSLIRQYLRADS